MKKKVACIGLGWVAREVWLPRFAEYPGFQIDSGYDTDESVACATQHKIPCLNVCNSIEQVLHSHPDLVVVAVPNALHVNMAELCLKRGASVLLEKPICLNMDDFHRLKTAVADSNAVLLPSKASRLRSDVCKMKQLINSGLIGKIHNLDLQWLRKSGIPKIGSWFTNKRLAGGGVGYDLGWHVLDVGLEILSYPNISEGYGVPIRNYGLERDAAWREDIVERNPINCDVETQMIALLRTDDGVAINLNVAWVSNVGVDRTSIVAHGQRGTLELATTFGFSPNRVSSPSLKLYKNGVIKDFTLQDGTIGDEYNAQVAWVHSCLCGSAPPFDMAEIECVVNGLEKIYSATY